MKTRSLACALAALLILPASMVTARAAGCDPYQTSTYPDLPKIQDLLDLPLPGTTGLYALPESAAPTSLAVFMHGYGNIADSWTCHLANAAAEHGAIAFATDYRGTGWTGAASDNRGWFVKEGAEEAVVLAKYFLAKYPSLRHVGLLGISMGGNASGLAASWIATRDDDTPLFDWWVDIEGVANITEEYVLANAVSPANAYAQGAAEDINEECRRNAMEIQDCLDDLSIVGRAGEVALSRPRGVLIVHGADDGLVPHNQSRELTSVLRGEGVKTDMYTVLRRNDGDADREGGTTATGTAFGPIFGGAGQTYPAPFAGHGWEGSRTHLVIKTGFDRFWSLLDANGGANAPADADWVVDPALGIQKIG